MRRVPARTVRACFVRSCCTDVVQEHDLPATPVQGNAKRRLSAHFTLYTSHATLHLISKHVSSSHLISQFFHLIHLFSHVIKVSWTVFISSEHWSTFLISSEVVLSSSQVLHARKPVLSERCLLHKKNIGRRTFLHTDTWDTDAFTYKTLSEILCTTKLAQRTSQYYFVIQSLHKLLPSTTVYYKTCTKHVPSTTLCKLCSTK